MQLNFLWHEPVYPPDHPDKTVFVRPHFRRPPGYLSGQIVVRKLAVNGNAGLQPRITKTSSLKEN